MIDSPPRPIRRYCQPTAHDLATAGCHRPRPPPFRQRARFSAASPVDCRELVIESRAATVRDSVSAPMAFASSFTGGTQPSAARLVACARVRTSSRPSACAAPAPATPATAPDARGCGWVRRAALNAGRAVRARTGSQSVEWSVPENEETPSCRLEALAWAADAEVENGREVLPFNVLLPRARAMPRANGDRVGPALTRENGGGVRVVRGDGPALVFAASADIPRLKEGASEGSAFVARELIALPYQVLGARLRGADAVVLQAAVWPAADIGYQCKLAAVLGMAVLVEAHTVAQARAVVEARPETSALVLVARDADGLSGDAASFEQLSAECLDELRAWGVPLVAEGAGDGDPEAEVALCPSADALLAGLPPL